MEFKPELQKEITEHQYYEKYYSKTTHVILNAGDRLEVKVNGKPIEDYTFKEKTCGAKIIFQDKGVKSKEPLYE